jgi:membrane-associated phospholipid phosphatase/predicted MFS family arabinose efflux permease
VSRLARTSFAFLAAFGLAEVGVGLARAATTTYVPVLLDRISHSPALIGAVMLVNAAAGFAVPLAVGVWSDRRRAGGLGRRTPFVIGGVAVTSAGLLAVAAGAETSYPVLGLAAGCVYLGLNATATAHRAVVVDRFEDGRRPAATSSQELAMLVGGLLGVGAGGMLIEGNGTLLFVLAAVVAPLLAVPTALVLVRMERRPAVGAAAERPRSASLRAALRHPGAREVLLAQILWVAGYVALPVFFVLYADRVLGLGPGAAAGMLAAFGLLTGGAMVVAGRARPERVFPLLVLGAALLGGGLVAAAPAGSAAAAALPFAFAAVGAGLVTALGFPYFARFVPETEAGSYSGLYFSVRAIASTVAVPLAGVLIEVTGSYRALMAQGAFALLALAPLALARARVRRPAPARIDAPPQTLAAVVPCHSAERVAIVVQQILPHVGEVVLVDDGAPEADAAVLADLAERPRVGLVQLAANAGKGDAVAAGAAVLLSRPDPPDAIVVVDADGQHPPDRIPEFAAAAARADVVIGDRRGDREAMPWTRRCTNAASSALLTLVTGQRMLDSQCGMRLYRSEALRRVPLPPGRYEAETRHLRSAIRAGLVVGWVPIPAIYDGEQSSFRPLADTWRVLGSIVAPPRRRHRVITPGGAFARRWALRFAAVVAGTLGLGLAMPMLQPLDERLFLEVNSLGAGPDWIHRALDPHTRNYILLCLAATIGAAFYGRRAAIGAALATTIAALWSDVLVQLVYMLHVRDRPEEVLGAQALLVEGGHWAHIAAFPSGHMVVTTAIVVAGMAAVPWLRGPFWLYCGLIGLTRITFGAHFPLDVLAGMAFGYPMGVFAWELVVRMRLVGRTPKPRRGWVGGRGLRRRPLPDTRAL